MVVQSQFIEKIGDSRSNPKGWDIYTLRELVVPSCPISYGIVQPGEDIEEGGVPIVRPVDLDETHRVTAKGLERTTKEISDAYRRTILEGNELLLCVRGTTGLVGLATEELKGCNVTRGITPLSFNERVDRVFMLCMFLSDGIQEFISDNTIGSALRGINMAVIREMKFPVPPIDIQRSFASLYEQADKSKFDGLKSQFIEKSSLSSSPLVSLKDVVSIVRKNVNPVPGKTYTLYSFPAYDNQQIPEIIDGGEIRSCKLDLTPNTVLYNKLNVRLCRVWNIREIATTNNICSTEFIPLKMDNTVLLQEYLVYFLTSEAVTKAMVGISQGTSNSQKRIAPEALLKLEIPLPPIEIQIEFVAVYKKSDKSKYLS